MQTKSFVFHLIIYAISFILLNNSSAICGTTGKIAGQVLDAQTKEPLIGVNIILSGTNFGASTDPDGYYFIINIAPGIYGVEADYIGYAPVVTKNVKVSVESLQSS